MGSPHCCPWWKPGLGVAIILSLAVGRMPGTLTPVPLRPCLERWLVLTGPIACSWHPNVTAIRDRCAKQARDTSSGPQSGGPTPR
ncbi:hypothetical protein [Nonomuraea jabiensis]|uniref:hypothetical protein n=1 Tax=Nonomuraea jabiensis TaxID=882448 RepID=UPI003D709C07